MELKLLLPCNVSNQSQLLIVPYGIETLSCNNRNYKAELLIVPYGIETILSGCNAISASLLIVPYGIETNKGSSYTCKAAFF